MEMVILVDHNDVAIGTMEKMEAHRKGQLHRAFSVLVYNSKGEILLQKRALNKYHSGGLWTNACCSHPLPGEKIEDAARRRLREEMGIDLQPEYAYKFIYKTDLDQNLIEHEYDHVYKATFNGEPSINKAEVDDWKFVDLAWLKTDVARNPEAYTYWFKLILGHPAMRS
jgi:isopentenyl-diphosphate delta-isomerase